MITTITFDWGDTLATNYGQPYAAAHRRFLERLEDDLRALGAAPPVDWQDRCTAEFAEAWQRTGSLVANPEHREMDMDAIMADWVRLAGLDPEQEEVRAAVDHFCSECVELVLAYDGAGETLAELKRRGYRIGILSHVAWQGRICREWYRRRGWSEYVDFYSFSSDVGWIKPNLAHYQHALDQAGCPAAEVLHVGDHPDRDVVGGREFGFQTCLRVTEGIYPAERIAACQPDLAVLHVRELLAELPGPG